MAKKHDVVKEICKILGISAKQSWFSSGSTVTRDVLDAIKIKVEKDNEYMIKTEPMPNELRSIFIQFMRGFEDYYRIIKSEDVLVKTKIFKNGSVGLNLEPSESNVKLNISNDIFSQWLNFAVSGDLSFIDSFEELTPHQKALVNSFRIQHLHLVVQSQMFKFSSGELGDAVQHSGLLSTNLRNINLNFSPQVNVNTYAQATSYTEINLGDQISEALNQNNKNELKKLLESAVEEEKKSTGYLKKILTIGKEAAGKIVIQTLLAWLNIPENVVGWSPMLLIALKNALA